MIKNTVTKRDDANTSQNIPLPRKPGAPDLDDHRPCDQGKFCDRLLVLGRDEVQQDRNTDQLDQQGGVVDL